jgi:hypothetical protein
MAHGHLPDLAAIYAVKDLGVRFYATVGACISLVAGVEHDLFDLYVDASGQSPDAAARVFYRHVKFSHKRDTVDSAVQAALSENQLLRKWNDLLHHVQQLAGPDAARNVLGHNSVSSELSFAMRKDVADIYEEFRVNQNANVVLAGLRPERTETLDSLEKYAQQLRTLRLRLIRFGPQLREVCGRPREQDAAALAARRPRARTRTQPPPEPPREP